MKDKHLLLICASGITTGLLVRNMQKEAKLKKMPLHIYSAPSITLTQVLKDRKVDGILIGPHIEHEFNDLSNLLNDQNIPFGMIDEEDYELLNSGAVLEKAQEVLDMQV